MEVLTVEEFARLYTGPQLSPRAYEIVVYTYNGIKVSMKEHQRVAYELMHKALASGELVRPHFCEECNVLDISLHGHHEDYEKPLEVEWLCSKCHIHRRNCVDMVVFKFWEIIGEILIKSLYMQGSDNILAVVKGTTA